MSNNTGRKPVPSTDYTEQIPLSTIISKITLSNNNQKSNSTSKHQQTITSEQHNEEAIFRSSKSRDNQQTNIIDEVSNTSDTKELNSTNTTTDSNRDANQMTTLDTENSTSITSTSTTTTTTTTTNTTIITKTKTATQNVEHISASACASDDQDEEEYQEPREDIDAPIDTTTTTTTHNSTILRRTASNATAESDRRRPLSISSLSSSSSSCSSLTRNGSLGYGDGAKKSYLASIESLNDERLDSDDNDLDDTVNSSNQSQRNSITSQIRRTLHGSLRYDRHAAYRVHWLANTRFGQNRYANISRNNSSTSSDSGHHVARENSLTSLESSASHLSNQASSITVRQHDEQTFTRVSKEQTEQHRNASTQSDTPIKIHKNHPKKTSKLHPSPSSASSHSNTSSLFRDDGFEDDHISTTSDRLSCVIYTNDEDEYQSCEEDFDAHHDIAQQHQRPPNQTFIKPLSPKSLASSQIVPINNNNNNNNAGGTINNSTPKNKNIPHTNSSPSHSKLNKKEVVNIISHMPTKTPGYWDPDLSITQRVITEIIETERTYVEDLEQIITGYIYHLRSLLLDDSMKTVNETQQIGEAPTSKLSSINEESINRLFSNLEDIYKFNNDLLFHLEGCYSNPGGLAKCFVTKAPGFEIYTKYCTMYPQIVSTLTELMSHQRSAEILKDRQTELRQSLPLGSYLLKPVQRILKYHILFQSLIKNTADDKTIGDVDRSMIKEAFSVMTNIACHINSMKKRHEHAVRVQEIQSFLYGWAGPDLTTLGELIMEESFKLYNRPKSSRHLILFDNILLVTKKKRDGSLCYKGHITCSNLMLIESIEGQPLVFNTVPFDNPRAAYTFQAKNLDRKRDWCLQLKEVIIKSYKNQIPNHVRQILMDLTHKTVNNKDSTSDNNKSHKVLAAPDYLEKQRLKHDKRRRNSEEPNIRNHPI